MTATRRSFAGILLYIAANSIAGQTLFAEEHSATFEDLLDIATSDKILLEAVGYRERQLDELSVPRGQLRRIYRVKLSRSMSERAIDAIVRFEVGGKARYERLFQRPTWPRGASGVTVGIGYDVGYVDALSLTEDWRSHISLEGMETLKRACRVRGVRAGRLTREMQSLLIPWGAAIAQFRLVELPKYISATLSALPNCNKLSDDSFGALVSLVYNRGPAFDRWTDRYAEMRAIRALMDRERFDAIPMQIRNMKRLWTGPEMRGVALRRDAEAKLFEEGLR